eukprot:8842268-Ditylum_brightwellii.AAC.1
MSSDQCWSRKAVEKGCTNTARKQTEIPGMELGAVSWVVDKASFAIDVHKVDCLCREELSKIEKGKPTNEKLSYIAMMEHCTRETQKDIIQTVIGMNSSKDNK